MTLTRIVVLAVLALMATLIAFELTGPVKDEESTQLLPGLKEQLPNVTKVEISRGTDTQVIERIEDAWVLPQKHNYPADFEKVFDFLTGLAEANILERKTAKPENHGKLGLAEQGDEAGTMVTISTPDQAYTIVLGNHATTQGTFVRLTDNPQTYVTENKLSGQLDAQNWLDPIVTNVDAEDVVRVEIARRDSGYLSASRDEVSGDLRLDAMPEGRELKYPTVVDSLARVLVNLRFTDVAPYDETMFERPALATLQLKSGESVEARTVQVDDLYWIHVSGQGVDEWQYQISQYNHGELNKSLEDLLKEVETDGE